MKILWVTTNFLHPTTRGGQIRTLEMLRRLHRRHQIHYVAIEDPREPEGLARAPEYSTRAYPFQHRVADKRSPAFILELARGLIDPEPVSIRRFHPPAMGAFLTQLMEKERFDREVCDFLAPAAYFPDITLSGSYGSQTSNFAKLFSAPTLIWCGPRVRAQSPWKCRTCLQSARLPTSEGSR